ncbi:MAG: 2,3-bisphosphoglycerate-independent phosphoglycerate mutase [Thermoplasmata archaeon]
MRCEKALMLILDGLPDRPVAELGNKTPLQVARKPALDRIVSEGSAGLMNVIAPGVVPGSDTAHLALFGYDPFNYYSGRGPFEAAGVGIECKPGDVAFRCNFSTVDEKMRVVDRRAGRIKSGTSELAKALSGMKIEGIEIIFKEATEHRGVLVLRGSGLDPHVSDVDPHEQYALVQESKPLVPEAALTARIVNEFVKKSYEILLSHPINLERASKGLPVANIVLPRGAGILRKLERFESRFDLKPAGIAGVSLLKGVFKILGFDIIDVKGATGGLDTDMFAKGAAAIEALDSHDIVAVNVKAGDIAGHDGDFEGKIDIIERVDKMVDSIIGDLPKDVLFVMLSDHSTPVSLRNHSADPVCIAMRGRGMRMDHVTSFDEVSCHLGLLNGMRGIELIPVMRGIMGRAEKFGA